MLPSLKQTMREEKYCWHQFHDMLIQLNEQTAFLIVTIILFAFVEERLLNIFQLSGESLIK